MPDTRLHDTSMFPFETNRYRIMRKGSRYNILGPQGRIFTKYQSASKAGPRWEDLTHTPWPYDSTAYERGHRLWELGLIARDQVGKRNIDMLRDSDLTKKPGRTRHNTQPRQPVKLIVITLPMSPQLALPAPRISLEQHERLMNTLRQNPTLLFTSQIRQALQHEIEYHRPQAKWAERLLKLLARYEQQRRVHRCIKSDADITAKHIEWQAANIGAAAAV